MGDKLFHTWLHWRGTLIALEILRVVHLLACNCRIICGVSASSPGVPIHSGSEVKGHLWLVSRWPRKSMFSVTIILYKEMVSDTKFQCSELFLIRK